MKLRAVLAVGVAVAAVVVPAANADPARVGYPNSIASAGDSITRAFNTCGFPFIDCAANSWSTGTSSSVSSVYSRILARNGLIAGKNANDAKTGARMIDLDGSDDRRLAASRARDDPDGRERRLHVERGLDDACRGGSGAVHAGARDGDEGASERADRRQQHPEHLQPLVDPARKLDRRDSCGACTGSASRCSRIRTRRLR